VRVPAPELVRVRARGVRREHELRPELEPREQCVVGGVDVGRDGGLLVRADVEVELDGVRRGARAHDACELAVVPPHRSGTVKEDKREIRGEEVRGTRDGEAKRKNNNKRQNKT
jgi:hypothetical protein